MLKKHLVIGLASTSILAMTGLSTKNVNADEPFCYMRIKDGKTIDLSKWCGRKLNTESNKDTSFAEVDNSANVDKLLQETLEQINSQNNGVASPSTPIDPV